MKISVSDNQHKADVRAYLGKTGGGKTTALLHDINTLNPARMIVWDYKHEYKMQSFSCIDTLYDHVCENKTFQLSFHVDQLNRENRARDFDFICDLAYAARACLVVEELQFVTEASRAPDAWSRVCTTGRKVGMIVMGTSQRPARMDKDFLGNCSHITCCGLGYEDDAATVAKSLPGITPQQLMDLAPGQGVRRFPGMEKAEIKQIFKP